MTLSVAAETSSILTLLSIAVLKAVSAVFRASSSAVRAVCLAYDVRSAVISPIFPDKKLSLAVSALYLVSTSLVIAVIWPLRN